MGPRGMDGPSKGAGWPYGFRRRAGHRDGIKNSDATEVTTQ